MTNDVSGSSVAAGRPSPEGGPWGTGGADSSLVDVVSPGYFTDMKVTSGEPPFQRSTDGVTWLEKSVG